MMIETRDIAPSGNWHSRQFLKPAAAFAVLAMGQWLELDAVAANLARRSRPAGRHARE